MRETTLSSREPLELLAISPREWCVRNQDKPRVNADSVVGFIEKTATATTSRR